MSDIQTYTGGLRDRLIHDSLYNRVNAGLEAIGWYSHPATAHKPVQMVPEQVDWDVEIQPNTISLAPHSVADIEFELGTDLRQNTWTFYADVFGENEALGLQISGDVRDILRGKFPQYGLNVPMLTVNDYTQATPAPIFYCEINNVTRDRAENTSHRWQRYLWVVRCEVVDYYDTVTDGATYSIVDP